MSTMNICHVPISLLGGQVAHSTSAQGWVSTGDPQIISCVIYQLSYCSTTCPCKYHAAHSIINSHTIPHVRPSLMLLTALSTHRLCHMSVQVSCCTQHYQLTNYTTCPSKSHVVHIIINSHIIPHVNPIVMLHTSLSTHILYHMSIQVSCCTHYYQLTDYTTCQSTSLQTHRLLEVLCGTKHIPIQTCQETHNYTNLSAIVQVLFIMNYKYCHLIKIYTADSKVSQRTTNIQ